jgi:carboxymethylenebutenolidase
MAHPGLQAETVALRGHNGDEGEAYYARPLRPGKVPGVIVIHHMPGWDEWTTEVVRKIAAHGYAAIAPHLFSATGPAAPTTWHRGPARRAAPRMTR